MNTETGIEFEKVVSESFGLIGFKSKWVEDDNNSNPDIILEAWRNKEPYLVAIECFANVSDISCATKEKVSQIRANGPKLFQDQRYKGKISSLYLVVVSRGGFHDSAVKSVSGDVVLLPHNVIEELLRDLENGLTYSQFELEEIFKGSGLKIDVYKEIKYKKYSRYIDMGMICYAVEDILRKTSEPIDIVYILGHVMRLNNQYGISLTKTDVMADLEFLCHPLNGIIIRDNRKILSIELYNEENFIKMGKIGKQIQNYYKKLKKRITADKAQLRTLDEI